MSQHLAEVRAEVHVDVARQKLAHGRHRGRAFLDQLSEALLPVHSLFLSQSHARLKKCIHQLACLGSWLSKRRWGKRRCRHGCGHSLLRPPVSASILLSEKGSVFRVFAEWLRIRP